MRRICVALAFTGLVAVSMPAAPLAIGRLVTTPIGSTALSGPRVTHLVADGGVQPYVVSTPVPSGHI